MKIAVVCRSDSTGGAAVVSRRLTEALLASGVEATMLVLEKRTEAPYVVEAHYPIRAPFDFMAERLRILAAMRGARQNLFKVDTAAFGLPLWRHPAVKEADGVILNWVNQGMLSLEGVRRISRSGKKVVWTMHDMWNFTGICHHAMECRRFEQRCGNCFLLGRGKGAGDLSQKTWTRKQELYSDTEISFVAVSNWLASEARKSSLLGSRVVNVIPNPISLCSVEPARQREGSVILFAAAGIDNWIKGFDVFKLAVADFKARFPEEAAGSEVVLMGGIKNPKAIEGLALPCRHLGIVRGDEALAGVYSGADAIVNTSHFENLPGTLVEGQAYGAVPVAFDRGGQRDIIDHRSTGYLATWTDDPSARARAIADGMAWAIREKRDCPERIEALMKENVKTNFSYKSVADRYLKLFQ